MLAFFAELKLTLAPYFHVRGASDIKQLEVCTVSEESHRQCYRCRRRKKLLAVSEYSRDPCGRQRTSGMHPRISNYFALHRDGKTDTTTAGGDPLPQIPI